MNRSNRRCDCLELKQGTIKEIVGNAQEYVKIHPEYVGLLLCEGNADSIDVKLYRKVYPYLHVVPSGGWPQIKGIFSSVKSRMNGFPVFAITDRDAKFKNEVRELEKVGIYCTKLPFIENIISAPEIVKTIGKYYDMELECGIDYVKEKLLYLLSASLRDTLPVNILHSEEDAVASITFTINLKSGKNIEKTVNESNIIYAYRDKAVANETADIFGIVGRRSYYRFFAECLDDPELCERIVRRARTYLPDIQFEVAD